MTELFGFLFSQIYFAIPIILIIAVMVILLSTNVYIALNSHLLDGRGGRGQRRSIASKLFNMLKNQIKQYDIKEDRARFYDKCRTFMKQCGFRSNYATAIYLCIQFGIPLVLFILSLIGSWNFISSTAIAILTAVIIWVMARSFKREMSKSFQKSGYKIYRYLNNQITAGVSIPDAIKSVYMVSCDNKIRKTLLDLSAIYASTNNIDLALEEFRSNYDIEEVDSLCVAIKQGIETGETKKLLSRQEKIMFKQYFTYVQNETERCKVIGALVISMLGIIIITMIIIPMFIDLNKALSSIFAS